MSATDGEFGIKNLTDKATYERLEKDVAAVKNDISALTEQITDALNSFAGTAGKQARRGYKQARANVDSAVDDLSERGSAAMDAAQDAATSIEETLEDLVEGRRGPPWGPPRFCFPDRRSVAPVTTDGYCEDRLGENRLERRRRCAVISFGSDIFESRRPCLRE